MSINSLANAAAARRTDIGEINTTPSGLGEIAAAAATPPEIAPPKNQTATGINTALNVLFGYIPTEVVTLYVAVVGALQPAATPGTDAAPAAAGAGQPAVTPDADAVIASLQSEWIAFWCFLLATPLAVWVIYASKIKAAGKPLPLAYSTWPLWEMTAAMIAFLAWAFALPNAPFRDFSWYAPALASIAVLVISTMLGLMSSLFQNKLEVPEPA